MADIMTLLARANELRKENKQEKIVSKVEKKEDIFVVEFSGKNGEELFIDQGVVLPVSLGFQPEVGMLALYTTESGGAIGDAADLTFKDPNGNKLFSAHRDRGIGLDTWNVLYDKKREATTRISEARGKLQHNNKTDTNVTEDIPSKYAFYSADNDTICETFIRLDQESGKVDHAFSCSPFTGLFYENLDEQYSGKTLEDLQKDETLANFCTKKMELKECSAQRFVQIEKMGRSKTYGRVRKF